MANSTIPACPIPFINELLFPAEAGAIDGRYCAKIAALGNASCCVPCPLQNYVYSDDFGRNVEGAFWISLPILLFQIFLMLSFAVLPTKEGHGHYLNWGLTISVSLLALSMIVPLAAHPNPCYDAITPNDMLTSMSCAWSGALLLAGAMGIVSWVLVRSLYTHLRVVWGLELPRWYPYFSHAAGWGLPGLGLAISLSVTRVSYQIGPLCLLRKNASFATFFGWYLTFSSIAGVIQLSTTLYCLWIFAKSFHDKPEQRSSTTMTGTQASGDDSVVREKQGQVQQISGMYRKKHGWQRVKKILLLQWRSILLSVLVVASATYFGAVYVVLAQTANQQISGPTDAPEVLAWALCLVLHKGNKTECLDYASRLGLSESGALAAFVLLPLTGVFTFALMVRTSMFTGWYRVLRSPKESLRQFLRRRSSVEEAFVLVQPGPSNNMRSIDSSDEALTGYEVGRSSTQQETVGSFGQHYNDQAVKQNDEIGRAYTHGHEAGRG